MAICYVIVKSPDHSQKANSMVRKGILEAQCAGGHPFAQEKGQRDTGKSGEQGLKRQEPLLCPGTGRTLVSVIEKPRKQERKESWRRGDC